MTLRELFNLSLSPVSVISTDSADNLVFRFDPERHRNIADNEVVKLFCDYDSLENEEGTVVHRIWKIVAAIHSEDAEDELDEMQMFWRLCADAQLTPEEILEILGDDSEEGENDYEQ